MSGLDIGIWPQAITTDRLTLRPMGGGDRQAIIDLLTNADAYRHLGGGHTIEQAETEVQPPYGEEPGSFVLVESESGHVIGTLQLDRRDPSRPGRLDASTGLARGELEVSYVLHPDHWGRGYASEAVAAGLAWVMDKVADGYVMAVTQTANTRSIAMLRRLGFVERERFPEFGVEQTLLTRALGDRLDERDGHLLLPSRGAPLTDDEVRPIRLADQR